MTTNGPMAGAPGPRVVRLSRTLDAPPERVWRALTEAGELEAWFWPREYGTRASADARVGGRYRLEAPQRERELAVDGEFLEVAPPRRLVLTWRWGGDDPASVVRIDVLGNERGSGLVLEHEGLAPGDVAGHEQGWSDSLDRLAEHVRGQQGE
jgi:uncharacterized protein YndB with AHSA1/START domain